MATKETTGTLSGHVADGRGHTRSYVCCLTKSERAMVSMVALNVRAMETKALAHMWALAYETASETGETVWRAIRDTYAAELDSREGR